MDETIRSLFDHPFLSGVDPAHWQSLAPLAAPGSFAKGAYLMHEGDEPRTFYLIRTGQASLEVHVPAKEIVRVATAGPGDVVGLSWMFPPARVQLDARALEPITATSFDAVALRRLMDEDHDLGYTLTRRLLRVTYDRLERVRIQRLDLYGS